MTQMLGDGPVEILLVEDNVADAWLFQEALRADTHVTLAGDGSEALDRLFRRGVYKDHPRPHLIVLDLNIPILSGHEVLDVIKSNSELSRIPVIVYSMSRRKEDVQKAYELGAAGYMVKASDLDTNLRELKTFAELWVKRARLPEY